MIVVHVMFLSSSLPGSLMGSRHSLVESAAGEDTEGQVESDDRDLDGECRGVAEVYCICTFIAS